MGQNPSSIQSQSAVNFCVYFNKAIPQAGEFAFCPWCGSKLVMQMHQEIEFNDIQCSFKDKDLIGSGTYAKVYKGKIRGVDVAIKVPNLEKILPPSGPLDDKEDSGSSPSSFISASESEAKSGHHRTASETGALDGSSGAIEPQPHPQVQKVRGSRKRFGFFRNKRAPGGAGGAGGEAGAGDGATASGDGVSFPDVAVGGGPASMGVLEHLSQSEEGLTTGTHDAEEFESFGDDGAEDSGAGGEGGRRRRGDDEEEEEEERAGGVKESSSDYNNVYSDRFQNFLGEVRMLRELNHPNICLLMGTCFVAQGSKSKLLLVYELMDEDLNSYINSTTKRKETPTLFQRLKIASQVASGLSWVASKGVVHGDLKPTNILRKGSIYKVTDFGLATFEIRMDDFEGGAPVWSAPELLEKRGDASRAVDVFSFGYLLWHILLWKNEEELYPNIANTADLIDVVCVRHELPPMGELPSALQDLIHECLAYNDTERPTFNHIIQALNAAMLEAAIPNGDKLARKFWMHFFASKSGTLQESVPTIIFLEKFLRFTSVSSRDPLTEVAKDFFDPEGRGAVTLEHFGRVISLFGPLCEDAASGADESPSAGRSKTPTSGRSSPNRKLSKDEPDKRARRRGTHVSSRIFHDMADLREEPWFCGAVTTDKVTETLRRDRPGSYLVRYSNNPQSPSNFCLSRVTKAQQIRHHYIVQKIVDGVKQFGLHVSKTEVVYGRSLALLLRDPRVTGTFFLVHPVNKLASFSKPIDRHSQVSDVSPDKAGGYLSSWDPDDSALPGESDDEPPLAASPQQHTTELFAGSPPEDAVQPRAARVVPGRRD